MNARRHQSRRARRSHIRGEMLEHRFLLSTLQGEKWVDTDGNSQRDEGEPPLAGVIVYLDTNDNQQLDEGELSTTTDASGAYSFTDLPAGEYIVREVVPDGFRQTYPLPTPPRLFGYDRSTSANNDEDLIVEFEPLNGQVLQSFFPAEDVEAAGNGMAYDAENNLVYHIDNRQRLLRWYSPDTGMVVGQKTIGAANAASPDGLAFLNGKLYIQDSDADKILVIDPANNHNIESTIFVDTANPGRDIDLYGGLGELRTPFPALVALTGPEGDNPAGDEILLLNPDTGAIISSFHHIPVDNDVFDLGATAIRNLIYIGFTIPSSGGEDAPDGEIHVYRLDGTLVQRYTEDFRISSLAASDPGTDDAHRVMVGSDEVLSELHFGNQPIPRVEFLTDMSMADEGVGTHQVQVALRVPGGVTLINDVTVDVIDLESGTAATPADYTFAPATVTFSAGAADGATQSVPVNIVDDDLLEIGETIDLRLVNLMTDFGVISVPDQHQVTIVDNDFAALTISDVMLTEGNAGSKDFSFSVTLDTALQPGFSVDFETLDGTAIAGSDYTAAAGTLNFAGNLNETQMVVVSISGDTTVELDETFTVVLSNVQAGGRTIELPDPGEGTIQNDDQAEVTIGDVSVSEGDAGTTIFTFPVSLSQMVDAEVSIDFATADDSAQTGDIDYSAASGTVTISAGDTDGEIMVQVNGDTDVELDEQFLVQLSGLAAAGRDVSLEDDEGIGTIVNDDIAFLSVGDASVVEGDDGTTQLEFPVSLSGPVGSDISVDFATADGTATGNDYVTQSGTLTIDAGSTSGVITVPVNGDTTVELDESLVLNLSNAQGAGVQLTDDQATGTIENDDQAQVTIGDASEDEGDAGTTAVQFSVSLDHPADVDISVEYSTANGTATTADSDYGAASGMLTIPAGMTSGSFEVDVQGDTTVELDEVFVVNLSSLSAEGRDVTLSDGQADGEIRNDDQAIFNVSDASGLEDAGPISFTISLSNPLDVDSSVQVTTADGSATTADDDYGPLAGQVVNFPAGSTTQSFTVSPIADDRLEGDEQFSVSLHSVASSGRDASASDAPGTGTIVNDDDVLLSIGDVQLTEGNSGSKVFEFVVSLTAAVDVDVSVDFETADDTAQTANGDYDSTSGSLTIAAGDSEGTISVMVHGDTDVEPDESFVVLLSNIVATGREIGWGDDQGVGTIENDDFILGPNQPPMITFITNSSPGCGQIGGSIDDQPDGGDSDDDDHDSDQENGDQGEDDHDENDHDDNDDDQGHGNGQGNGQGNGHGNGQGNGHSNPGQGGDKGGQGARKEGGHSDDDFLAQRTISVLAHFVDPDMGDTHTAEILWGDGASTMGMVIEPLDGQPGMISGTHLYEEGGIYTITVIVTDAQGASDSAMTITFVTGVGVHDGVLQIIGTDFRDRVTINQVNGHGQQRLRIHANFVDRWQDVATSGIDRVWMVLCDGPDTGMLAGNIALPSVIDGGKGDDMLKGGRGADILLGGDDRDFLNGHRGQDLLIGGLGEDRIVGGPHDDILIGGTTAYDNDYEALDSVLREWNSERTYQERVDNIQNATGPILEPLGVYLLRDDDGASGVDPTVFDDGDRDQLTGSSGDDWLLFDPAEDRASTKAVSHRRNGR